MPFICTWIIFSSLLSMQYKNSYLQLKPSLYVDNMEYSREKREIQYLFVYWIVPVYFFPTIISHHNNNQLPIPTTLIMQINAIRFPSAFLSFLLHSIAFSYLQRVSQVISMDDLLSETSMLRCSIMECIFHRGAHIKKNIKCKLQITFNFWVAV